MWLFIAIIICMNQSTSSMSASADQVASLVHANRVLRTENADLKHQLEWFRRQIFGKKSERRPIESDGAQLSLMELPAPADDAPRAGQECGRAHPARQGAGPRRR